MKLRLFAAALLLSILVVAGIDRARCQHEGHGGVPMPANPPRQDPGYESPPPPPDGQDGPSHDGPGHRLPEVALDAEYNDRTARELGLEPETWKGLMRLGMDATTWKTLSPRKRSDALKDFMVKKEQVLQRFSEISQQNSEGPCDEVALMRKYLGDEKIRPLLERHEKSPEHRAHGPAREPSPPPHDPSHGGGVSSGNRVKRLLENIAECAINGDMYPGEFVSVSGGGAEHAGHAGGGAGGGGAGHAGHPVSAGGSHGGHDSGGDEGHSGHVSHSSPVPSLAQDGTAVMAEDSAQLHQEASRQEMIASDGRRNLQLKQLGGRAWLAILAAIGVLFWIGALVLAGVRRRVPRPEGEYTE